MTFVEAVRELVRGKEIYRPHWKVGMHLCMALYHGKKVIVKQERGKPFALWIAEPGDLSANDWETEAYITLGEASTLAFANLYAD